MAQQDLAPVLLWGSALAAVGLVALALRRPKPAQDPSAAPPPPAPATKTPKPSTAALLHPEFPPLYLYVLQDGATDWTGLGWFYGHPAQIVTPGSNSARTVWYTPEGEIRPVLDDLVDQGIAGWFDTIEPQGALDRNFTGRLDQADRGVWFWVDDGTDPAHYEAEDQHHIEDYVG